MAVNIVTGMTGTAHITSDDDRCFNAATFGKGEYVFDYGQKFSADVINNNLVRIHDGMCIVQGTQMGIELNDYEDVIIENGISGWVRADLIAMRYERNKDTSIEKASLVVIKGEPVNSDKQRPPIYPKPTSGNILDGGDLIVDFPLYYVTIESLSIGSVQQLFTVLDNAERRKIMGLENVDNTKDSAKEVKSATRLANTQAIGGSKKPVYFNAQGVPEAIKYSLGDACAKGVSTSLDKGDTNLITSGAVAAGIEQISGLAKKFEYEVGEWTPRMFDTASNEVRVGAAFGQYYVLGDMVFIEAILGIVGSCVCHHISGLPYAPESNRPSNAYPIGIASLSKGTNSPFNQISRSDSWYVTNDAYGSGDISSTWYIYGWYRKA